MTYRDAESTSTAPPELRGCLSWAEPASGRCIYMQAACLRTITSAAIGAFKQRPSSEIGGILFGETLAGADRASTVINDVRLVDSEELLYNTSPDDAAYLAAAVNAGRAAPDSRVLGYFRSHIRDGLCLSEQDRDLIEQHMRDPESVFLIVRPYDMGVCMAGFFFWQNGRLQMDASDLEVPFFVPEGSAGEPPRPRRQQIRRQAPAPVTPIAAIAPALPAPRVEPPAQPVSTPIPAMGQFPAERYAPAGGWPAPPSRFRPEGKWLAIAALLLVSGLVFYWVQFRSRTPLRVAEVTPAKTEIGLRVDRDRRGQLNLSWNRDIPALATVQSARLTIVDGGLQRQLDIDTDQLRFGRITYFPNSGNVQFHLELYLDADHSLAETVRVGLPAESLGSAEPSTLVNPLQPSNSSIPQSRTITTYKSSTPLKASAIQSATRNLQPTSLPSAKADAPSKAPPVLPLVTEAANAVPKEFVDNLKAAHQSPAGAAPKPAESSNSTATSIKTASAAGQKISGEPPAIGTTDTAPATPLPSFAPVQVPPAPDLPSAKGAAPTGPASIDVLPRPVRRVLPETRQLGLWMTRSLTVLQVQVRIDEDGRVIAAHVLNKGERSNPFLFAQSIAAAKQWRFQPAQSGGKNIPSDYVIIFRFRPAE